MDLPRSARFLTREFRRLSYAGFEIVGKPSKRYNCISYAAGDTTNPWSHHEDDYWPEYATRSADIQSLVEVFAGLGFVQCQDSSLESCYEKVALYEERGVWTHAAYKRAADTGAAKWDRVL